MDSCDVDFASLYGQLFSKIFCADLRKTKTREGLHIPSEICTSKKKSRAAVLATSS